MTADRLKITVVVCTFRRDDVLCETLRELIQQCDDASEIVVVDQVPDHASSTTKFLEDAVSDGQIRYFERDQAGLTAARNYGAKVSKGDILLFCDDDIVPANNLIDAHRSNYSNADIHAVAGQVLHIGEEPEFAPGTFRHTERILGFSQLYGANFSVRRSTFLAIGGADEKLGIHSYTEDVLLARSLTSQGFKITYDPNASARHLKHATGGCRITDQTQPTSEIDRPHSRLYLYHRLKRDNQPGTRQVFWAALRDGPLRRHNVVRWWRQPYAWACFVQSYLRARRDVE